MTRTVLVQGESPRPYRGPGACGFCTIATREGVKHHLCPGTVRKGAGGRDWTCACHATGHEVE